MESNFVNKYKTKYPNYHNHDNFCTASTDFHTFKVQPKLLDQIEDVDFWNRSYNYTNIVNDDGQTIGLKGVCNPLLINNCEKPGNDIDGICNIANYINTKKYFLSYKK